MTTPEEAVAELCREVEIPAAVPDPSGAYRFEIDGAALRIIKLRNQTYALVGVIGAGRELAEARRTEFGDLLRHCLQLSGARLHAMGTNESLTWEAESGELVLWRNWDFVTSSIATFFQAIESMLNELETWKRLLSAQ